MTAIYPIVGGTTASHKYNLKDPQDTDGAYRVTFAGGMTHSSNGIHFDGTTGYGDTHLDDNFTAEGNKHLSVYSRTDYTGTVCSIGTFQAGIASTMFLIKYASNDGYFRLSWGSSPDATITNSKGYFLASRDSSTSCEIYQDGTLKNTRTQGTGTGAIPYYIGANYNAGSAASFSPREYCFWSVGTGLSSTQCADLSTRVEALQVALGRNN